MSRATRRRAEQRGQWAEQAAAWWLRLKGYRILARQERGPMGEIDLIATRGNTLAFIEVKSRATFADALDAVSSTQRGRIERAASHYVALNPALENMSWRFDIVAVIPGKWPRHMVDAWRP